MPNNSNDLEYRWVYPNIDGEPISLPSNYAGLDDEYEPENVLALRVPTPESRGADITGECERTMAYMLRNYEARTREGRRELVARAAIEHITAGYTPSPLRAPVRPDRNNPYGGKVSKRESGDPDL